MFFNYNFYQLTMLCHDNGTSMLLEFCTLFVPLKIRKNVCQTERKLPLFINSYGVIRLKLWSYPSGDMELSI